MSSKLKDKFESPPSKDVSGADGGVLRLNLVYESVVSFDTNLLIRGSAGKHRSVSRNVANVYTFG